MAQKTTIGRMVVRLLMDSTEYKEEVDNAMSQARKLSGTLSQAGDNIGRKFSQGMKVATAAMVSFSAASAIVGNRFEHQMQAIAAVRGLTDRLGKDYQNLEKKARSLGETTMFTATQAAEGMEQLARAGMSVDETISASDAALKLAGATGISMVRSTTVMAATLKQFSLEAGKATHVADVFGQVTRHTLFDMTSLTEAMKFAGVTGAALGHSLEETTAAVAQFRNLGLEGSMAGTNFRMVMAALAKITPQAAKALKKYGIELDDVNPRLNSFVDIMEKLGKAGVGGEDMLKIFGKRSGFFAKQIADNLAISREGYDELLEKLENSGGTIEQMYETMMNSVTGRTFELRSAFEELLISFQQTWQGEGSSGIKGMLVSMKELVIAITTELKHRGQEINDTFDGIFDNMGGWIDRNREKLAIMFVNGIETAQQFFSVMIEIGKAFAIMIPYLDDILVLLGATFVALKVASYYVAITQLAAGFGSLSAAVTALGMAVTLTMPQVAALVFVFGTLAAYVMSTNQEVQKFDERVSRLVANKKELFSSLQKQNAVTIAADLELLRKQHAAYVAQQEKLGLLNQALKETENLITNISDLDLSIKIDKGELLEVRGVLMSIDEIGESMDMAGMSAFHKKASELETEITDLGARSKHLVEAMMRTSGAHLSTPWDKEKAQKAAGVLGWDADEISAEHKLVLSQMDDLVSAKEKMEKDLAAVGDRMRRKEAKANAAALERTLSKAKAASKKWLSDKKSALEKLAKLEEKYRAQNEDADANEEQLLDFKVQRELLKLKEFYDKALSFTKAGTDDRKRVEDLYQAGRISALEKYEKGVKILREKARDEELKNWEEGEKGRLKILEDRQKEALAKIKEFQDKWGHLEEDAYEEMQGELDDHLKRQAGRIQLQADMITAGIKRGSDEWKRQMDLYDKEEKGRLEDKKSEWGKFFKFVAKHSITAAKHIADGFKQAINIGKDMFSFFTGTNLNVLQMLQDVAGREFSREVEGADGEMTTETFKDPRRAAREFIQEVIANVNNMVMAMVDALPVLIGELIPALVRKMPDIVKGLQQALTGLIRGIPGIVDDLIWMAEKLVRGVIGKIPKLVNALASKLPDLINHAVDMIVNVIGPMSINAINALMENVDEILQSIIGGILKTIHHSFTLLTDIVGSIVAAIPDIVEGIIDGIIDGFEDLADKMPEFIESLFELIFEKIPNMVVELITVLIQKLPELAFVMGKAFVLGIYEFMKQLGGIVRDIFMAVFAPKKFEAMQEEKRRQEELGADTYGLSSNLVAPQNRPASSVSFGQGNQSSLYSYSGISYVPATMRATVHQGEAIVPAHRNAQVMGGGPALAGGPPLQAGGPNSSQPINLQLMIDGKVVEEVMVRAGQTGRAIQLDRKIRTQDGVEVGVNPGRYSRFSTQ